MPAYVRKSTESGLVGHVVACGTLLLGALFARFGGVTGERIFDGLCGPSGLRRRVRHVSRLLCIRGRIRDARVSLPVRLRACRAECYRGVLGSFSSARCIGR